ncbi:myo-inositol-1(or 4)-monophosphatase [Lentzea atacamensis]|uniref:inositol-phosphate phosphatase n=1 Tax=Lentzea atacamensis TaxID=531938 RepID=A0ABX9DVW2_9PSEU|nr:inositol monophosphatase family protein [Lentzea atacamensis]RAS59426.1 myo-inositol-1(or 4)-monophosphatase [Lentzea atacamensis]
MTTELEHLLTTAHHAVDHAEQLLRGHPPTTVHAKGDRDMATDTDVAIERAVRARLAHETPAIPVHGEEEGGATAGTRWELDPIDGTANHLRGLPLTGISLALIREQIPILGVISLPLLRTRHWALAGHGAFCDGQPITASPTTDLAQALIAVGDYGTGPDAGPRNTIAHAVHQHLAPRAQRIRMFGSAAVDLAWLAAGHLDASITLGNRAWDMAAGAVIAREAGAHVVDHDGTDHTTASRFTIATAPGLLTAVLDTLHAALDDARTSLC